MKINHVGLNVQNEEEMVDFYQNILGFHFEYQFDIPKELGVNIFGENKQVEVFLYKREDILLELFVHSSDFNHGFSHICLQIKDRENIVSRCEESEYKVIRIKRNGRTDILFVKDKAENIFELKEGN